MELKCLPGELALVRDFVGFADELGGAAAFSVGLVHVLRHLQRRRHRHQSDDDDDDGGEQRREMSLSTHFKRLSLNNWSLANV